MEIYTNSIAKAGTAHLPENPFEGLLENITSPYAEKEDKHEIISTVAYLIGIPQRIFDNPHESPMRSRYQQLELDKNARIIRNLCMIRTAIERNFKAINDRMTREHRTLYYLDELPREAMKQLVQDGVHFIKKSSTRLAEHVVELNRLISDRINNCRGLFPDWLKWDYVRDLFVMPNGLTEAGTKEAADVYYANKQCYPYQVYINWRPYEAGNILFNDHKFVTLLYEQHNDYFYDAAKTRDVGEAVKNTIYDFIGACRKVAVFVDCENTDPYKLCAALRALNSEELAKISGILLFDDRHTTAAWQVLEHYTHIPVEHLMVERLLENKSLVDGMLTARACREHYINGVDGLMLVSSDSDYSALISTLSTARFFVMVERDKQSPRMEDFLRACSIDSCCLDDFYDGALNNLKLHTVQRELDRLLAALTFDLGGLLDQALQTARATLSPVERDQLLEKCYRRLQLSMDDNSKVALALSGK